MSIKRDGKDLVVYVARGLAILPSPGGRVEIGAGEQGIAKADQKPLVTSVAFWQDWTGGMGDQRGARSVSSGTGRLYGLDPSAATGSPARILGSSESWERGSHAARYRSEILQRKIPLRLVVLAWDGRTFKVTTKKGELRPGAKSEVL